MSDSHTPVAVPLVREPWGLLRSLSEARKNVLSIIPDIATKQPIVSGKTGVRWHMLMDPDAIRRVLLEETGELSQIRCGQRTCCAPPSAKASLLPKARIGAGSGVRRPPCFPTATSQALPPS